MWGWSCSRYRHHFTHHYTHSIWNIITQLKCRDSRVMLGGEIYYRAIGRPWGPAADFIVTVKFHPLTAVATGRRPGPSASGRSH
jgi:hypothetical protein